MPIETTCQKSSLKCWLNLHHNIIYLIVNRSQCCRPQQAPPWSNSGYVGHVGLLPNITKEMRVQVAAGATMQIKVGVGKGLRPSKKHEMKKHKHQAPGYKQMIINIVNNDHSSFLKLVSNLWDIFPRQHSGQWLQIEL